MPHPAQQIVLQEYIDAVHENLKRVERLTLLAEMGDLSRFVNPSQLMAHLGLVPSEYSTGDNIKKGGITKTGNSHARKVLIEAAWSYRMPAPGQSFVAQAPAGTAGSGSSDCLEGSAAFMCPLRKLLAGGKSKQVAATAVARELSAFLWAMAKQVQPGQVRVQWHCL